MRDDSEEMLEFPLVHHASVRTPVRRFGCGGSKSALCCSEASICLFSSISVISPLVWYHPRNWNHAIPGTTLFVMMRFLGAFTLFL